MFRPVITVENLAKKYSLQHKRTQRYTTLRDVLMEKAARPFRRNLGEDVLHEDFWALKDISFQVEQGEVLGIIGRNGAGKSTLLKILSRITDPTEGRVCIRGRVASLLEVGTGFHPELTGRENIFLNGAILGMTRAEIKSKFDEIVAFAEVEKFLDTPVKRYSSGMYVRLAFAVAAHLEPEILIIDEVLAVGDVEFQQKCLGKMEEVSRQQGRTVLFVSHNLKAVRNLCQTALFLKMGHLDHKGAVEQAITEYVGDFQERTTVAFKPGADCPSITGIALDTAALRAGDLIVDIAYQSPTQLNPPVPGVVITSLSGTPVFGSNPRFCSETGEVVAGTAGVLRLVAHKLPLPTGNYRLSAWLGDWQTDYDHKPDALAFEFRPGFSHALRPSSELIGYLEWPSQWQTIGTS